jgi:hypothetical protein
MRKNEIELGNTYLAKISGTLTIVRIDHEHYAGGWTGTNLATGREVRIRTAGKLRMVADPKSEIGQRLIKLYSTRR